MSFNDLLCAAPPVFCGTKRVTKLEMAKVEDRKEGVEQARKRKARRAAVSLKTYDGRRAGHFARPCVTKRMSQPETQCALAPLEVSEAHVAVKPEAWVWT